MGEGERHGTERASGYPHEIAYVVGKRKWFILGVTVVVVLGVMVGLFLATPAWQASAILMVKRDRGELVVSPAQLPVGYAPRVTLDQDVRSEAEMLRRRSLLAQVVETLGAETALRGALVAPEVASHGSHTTLGLLPESLLERARPLLAVPARWLDEMAPRKELPPAERAVAVLDQRLRVTPLENSNLIKVTFEATDPKFAAKVLELLVHRYLEDYSQLRSSPGAVDFFRGQATRLAHDLRQAEDDMQRFEASEGLSALGVQRELYLRTALEQESVLQLTRSEVEELTEKSRALRGRLQTLPERVMTAEEVRANPIRDAMRNKLMELEVERNKLLQKYTEQDRRVTDNEREIELLKQRILAEASVEFAKQSYGENPIQKSILLDVITTEAQLIRSEVKARNLEREVGDASARIQRVQRLVYDRSRHERRIKMLEEAYLLYAKKFDEARIASAMDQSRILNIAVAEPVQVAARPVASGRGGPQLMFLGIVVGLVSGVGGAFAREYFNRSFTTERSVRRHLGLPVIGSIADRG